MTLIRELWQKGKIQFEEMKRELLAVAFCSFIVYLPFMSEQLNNADGFIWGILRHDSNYAWENNQGRFFLRFFDFWRDGMVLPALIIGICLLFLWASAAVLWCIFDIRNIYARILTGILVVCTPSAADLFTYYYTADSYCFGFFLAVFAAALLVKGERKKSSFLAIVLTVVFLGIYQPYMGITVTICGYWLLYQVLKNEMESKELYKKILRFLSSEGFGIALYLSAFFLLEKMGYLARDSARGADHALLNVFSNAFYGVGEIYRVFIEYFFTDTLIYNAWHGRRYVNALILVLILFIIIMVIWKNKVYKDSVRCALGIALVILIPVMLELVILMAPETSVHAETGILMLCGMNFFYLLPVLLLPLLKGQKWVYTGTDVMVKLSLIYMSVFMCIFIGVFERMVQTEHTKFGTLAVRLESRIEELGDYSSGIKVLVVGRPQSGNYPFVDDTYKTVTKGMISDYSLVFGRADQVSMSWIELFKYYCGVRYTQVSEEQRLELMESPEFAQMENYPAETSVRWIDDVVVIKLSEYVK